MKKRVFDQEMVKESIRAVRLETDEIKLTAGKNFALLWSFNFRKLSLIFCILNFEELKQKLN